MIKKISLVALIFILIGIAGILLSLRNEDTKIHTISDEKVFKQTNFSAIEVETDNSGIEVLPAKDEQLKIKVTGKARENHNYDLTAEVKGDTLHIKLNDHREKYFSVDFISFTEFVTLQVYLPEREYSSLKILSRNGRIELQDLKVRDLLAQSNNGRIALKNIKAADINVRTDNGQISFEYVDGNIKGKSNNGKISAVTRDLDRSIELETDNGRIEIQTEKEPTNTTFDVYTGNGNINILGRYQGNAVIGKGENMIKLTTHNGSISVTK